MLMAAITSLSYLLFLLVACCYGDEDGELTRTCDNGGALTEGALLLDRATKLFLASDAFRNLTIPDFNQSAGIGGFQMFMQFSNASVSGLEGVRRLGDNYIDARKNESMQIRLALELDGLNISVNARLKVLIFSIALQIQVFVPALTFIAEIEESDNKLELTRFELNKTGNLRVKFKVLTPVLRLFNVIKSPLEAYLNFLINVFLRGQIESNVNKQLNTLSQRGDSKEDNTACTNCTTLDATISNAAHAYSLDPVQIPASVASMLSRVITVEVVNGTVSGLSKLRQTGDFVVRIDSCGAYVFVNLTLTNLTLTLTVKKDVFFVSFEATVTATVSARIVLELIEKNSTLFLENLVLKMLRPIDVKVTPIGLASSYVTMFLPTTFLASALTAGMEPLAKNTIKKALVEVQKFARGE